MEYILQTKELKEQASAYVRKMCGMGRTEKSSLQKEKKMYEAWDEYLQKETIKIFVTKFDDVDLGQDEMKILGVPIGTNLVRFVSNQDLGGVYVYLFHAPKISLDGKNVSTRFFVDMWQTALLNVARQWLEQKLRSQSPICVSASYGPGYFGMGIDAIKKFNGFFSEKETGIEVLSSGMMNPVKSVVGFFLETKTPLKIPKKDCANCKSTKGCEFCM